MILGRALVITLSLIGIGLYGRTAHTFCLLHWLCAALLLLESAPARAESKDEQYQLLAGPASNSCQASMHTLCQIENTPISGEARRAAALYALARRERLGLNTSGTEYVKKR